MMKDSVILLDDKMEKGDVRLINFQQLFGFSLINKTNQPLFIKPIYELGKIKSVEFYHQ